MSELLLDWDSNIPVGDETSKEKSDSVAAANTISTTTTGGELAQYTKEFQERQTRKKTLRKQNLDALKRRSPGDDAAESSNLTLIAKLDSNLKKNTNFVRKLKTISESQRDGILKDFQTLNLTKYVAEIASNLCEAKLKMSDVPFMTEFCSLMHQRYADFAACFLENFKKSFPAPTTKVAANKDSSADKQQQLPLSNPSKFRVDLRLLAELIVVGAVAPEKEALNLLGATLKYLCTNPGGDYRHLPLIITFLKYSGDDFAGLVVPRRIRRSESESGGSTSMDHLRSDLLSAERQRTVRSIFVGYYRELADLYLTRSYRDLKRLERRNRRQYETKGEVHPEAQQRWDEAKGAFDKLHQNAVQLADLLDLDPPDLPTSDLGGEDSGGEEGAGGGSSSNNLVVVGGGVVVEKVDLAGARGVWEDEDTRMFYETLPELRVMLPGILFKESEQATLPPLVEEKMDVVVPEEATPEPPPSGDDQQQAPPAESEPEPEQHPEPPEPEPEREQQPDEEEAGTGGGSGGGGGGSVTGPLMKQMMEAFVAELPNTINRDLIDRAAIDFVTNLNTKPNRKRLVKALFGAPRTRQDLLPFYGRLVAILQPVMPDVGTELVRMLLSDFNFQLRKKEPFYVESKVKVMRFIGELVKFKIFPKSEALNCLKRLLYDFRHHQIEMACALLDTCGLFLYCTAESHQKTKILLEQMERKTRAMAYLEQRYQLMVDNALATCKPEAAISNKERVQLPPWQLYMRKVIFKDLEKSTVEKVLRQMRKFDWDDPLVCAYGVRCLSEPWQVKFTCVQWLASLLAGLMYYYDQVGHRVVDNVMEELRLGMEANHPVLNQRRLCCAKYLAEMYNYRVVDSPVVFHALYSMVTFGVTYDHNNSPSHIDPPEHLLRIRLACTILETCGEYFDRGMAKKKLECYLTYLQRYYWFKKQAACWTTEFPFPVEVDNVIKDTIQYLPVSAKMLLSSYEEADTAVKKMESEYREKAESALKFVQPADEPRTGGGGGGGGEEEWEEDGGRPPLRAIAEEDEEASQTGQAATGSLGSQGAGGSQGTAGWRDRATYDDHYGMDGDEEETDECRVRPLMVGGAPTVDQEDEEFTAAFDRLMAESFQQRMQEAVKTTQVDIPLPGNVKTKLAARAHFEDDIVEPSSSADHSRPQQQQQQPEFVTFGLLTKPKGGQGGKQALKNIKVPAASDLARLLRDREQEEMMEKERMKQLTLDISRRMQQEEELAEMADLKKKVAENLGPKPYGKVHPPTSQQPRQQQSGSGPDFHHQRGAPGPREAFAKTWQRR